MIWGSGAQRKINTTWINQTLLSATPISTAQNASALMPQAPQYAAGAKRSKCVMMREFPDALPPFGGTTN